MTSEPEVPHADRRGGWCPRCGNQFVEGAVFCDRCGAVNPSMMTAPSGAANDWRTWAIRRSIYAQPRTRHSARTILRSLSAFSMITAAVFLFVELVALFYGINIVLPELANATYAAFIITPSIVPIADISGAALGVYFIFLVSAIAASAIWMALSSAKRFKAELSMTAPTREHSSFFDICGLFFATLFFDYTLYLIMKLLGEEPTSPIDDEEIWSLLFSLANASVWEEIISRILLIGVPLIFVDLFRRRWQPKKLSYILGGGFRIGVPETALVVFSALMFGFAHYQGGWESWKILPTSIGGVMFGYLFLRYGVYASIMLHFGINYMLAPTEITGSDGVLFVTGVLILLWIGLGAVFFFYYLTRIAEFVTGKRYFEARKPYASVMGAGYGYQGSASSPPFTADTATGASQPNASQDTWSGAFYVCPHCGNTEAKWTDGKFQCLRCGKLS